MKTQCLIQYHQRTIGLRLCVAVDHRSIDSDFLLCHRLEYQRPRMLFNIAIHPETQFSNSDANADATAYLALNDIPKHI